MTTAIQLTSLTKRFPAPGGGTTTAVDAVTLQIQPGELFFLLGPSGCGKTTLLRMIAGFIEPTSGSILFEPGGMPARDVTFLPPNKRNTGMVFQSYALWPHMSVAKNVAFGLEIRKVPPAQRDQRVKEALEVVRMGQYAERKPNQLSGGQQQRVALARALVVRPDVLLLDEPLSNLDAKLRLELRSEIRRICKQAGADGHSITTIYVTHDQKEALSMADRVAIVSQGKIEQLGGPAELYRRPRSRFVAEFLGETNFVPCDNVAGESNGAGAVQTPLGRLASAHITPEAVAAGKGVCSVRPEALHVGRAGEPNTFEARILETVYLGETAQWTVEAAGGTRLKVAALNPGLDSGAGRTLCLGAHPEDIVVLA